MSRLHLSWSPPSPRGRRRRGALTAAVLALGLLTPSAAQASVKALLTDCALDGVLDKTYSAADYANALARIPTDVDEYSDCRDVIRRGQLDLSRQGTGSSESGGGTGGAGGVSGTGGGAAPGAGTGSGATAGGGTGLGAYDAALAAATPQERASVADAAEGSSGGVQVAGQQLRPDALGHGDLGSLNTLPTPLIVVLALLALGTLAAAVPAIRAVVRTRLQRTA